jgi:hypothetical protein
MTTYATVVGMPNINGNAGDPLPQVSNPSPSGVGTVAAIVLNLNKINSNAGNPLPQAANTPTPLPGARVIAILFPTVSGGGYGVPI